MLSLTKQLMMSWLCLLALVAMQAQAQTATAPPISLPYQSVGSEDPMVTSSIYGSNPYCNLYHLLGTGSDAQPIGPLTPQGSCMSMTLQTINGQTLPLPGVITIFGTLSSASSTIPISISSAQPTTAPIISPASNTQSSITQSSTSASGSRASSTSAGQANSGRSQNHLSAPAGWVARQNIVLLLITTFAILAGVTYFLDELLSMLV